jgi:hypothetical protein
VFPELPAQMQWEALVDTAEPTGLARDGVLWRAGEAYHLKRRSFALFIDRSGNGSVRGRR